MRSSEGKTLHETKKLLRRLLDQVDDGSSPCRSLPENGHRGSRTIVFDTELDGFHYTLTRFSTSDSEERSTLSPREQEVVRLVANGHSNKAVADILEISPWTVSTHLRRVFAKLEVGSRAEMVACALKNGLLKER